MTKTNWTELIREYIIITIGVILVAFGIQYFFSPNELAAGGLSGMALIISHYAPALSVGTTIFFGNLILYVVAFLVIGGEFGFKTLYASFGLSFVIEIMEKWFNAQALTTNLFLAVIGGTLCIATGLAIVFARNSSTGGTDILAKILNKYTTFNIGFSLLCVDFFVTLCGGLTFGMEKGMYALVAVVLNGLLIDKLIEIINKRKPNENSELETV